MLWFKFATWSKGRVTMSWSPSKVNYHPAKFGGHRHYGNGDIVVLVCHITSQDHVIKASCDFMGKGPSRGGERCVDFGGCRKRLHVLSLNPPLMLIFKAHSMKVHGMSYKYVRCWSHASRVTNDETLAKKFCQSVTETRWRRKDRKTKVITKLSALHANTIPGAF